MGRPKKEIDPKTVEAMAFVGAPNTDIAAWFGVTEGLIRKRFSEILAKSRSGRRTKLRELQWEAAKKGSNAMLIWLGKQDLGQTDKVESKQDSTVIIKEKALDTSPKTVAGGLDTAPKSD